jgi:hypothetical protein
MRLTSKGIPKPGTVVIGKILTTIKALNNYTITNTVDGKRLLKNIE